MSRAFVVAVALLAGGCRPSASALQRASRDLAQSVARGDEAAVRAAVTPHARARLDAEAMLAGKSRKTWSKTLSHPVEVHPEALLLLPLAGPVRVVESKDGWHLAEDPTDLYRQDTPRQALRTFVLATHMERWDVLLGLAPRRFRTGLTVDALARAWTNGHQAQAMRDARDRLVAHLEDPIVADAHDAVLTISEDHRVRFEREADRWVIVEFLPETATGRG